MCSSTGIQNPPVVLAGSEPQRTVFVRRCLGPHGAMEIENVRVWLCDGSFLSLSPDLSSVVHAPARTTHTHTCTHTRAHTHTYHTHTHKHTHASPHTHTADSATLRPTHTLTRTHTHTRVHTHTLSLSIPHTRTHTYKHATHPLDAGNNYSLPLTIFASHFATSPAPSSIKYYLLSFLEALGGVG